MDAVCTYRLFPLEILNEEGKAMCLLQHCNVFVKRGNAHLLVFVMIQVVILRRRAQ